MRRRIAQFWGLHAEPSGLVRWALILAPFVLLVGLYLFASDLRHRENAADKLLPTPVQMAQAIERMAFTSDPRSGDYLLLKDTLASLKRLAIGVLLAAAVGLLLGLNTGLFPGARTLLTPFITFVAIIPPLAILPILFITFGVDELAKVMLIFIGLFPMIARDMQLAVRMVPEEQLVKARTLGASAFELGYRIVLPQVLPRLIEAIRLALGAAWLFLIAAEAIAASEGLGYRIFLVRRYLAMDVILPYVFWITLIGFTIDLGLRTLLRIGFPWYGAGQKQ